MPFSVVLLIKLKHTLRESTGHRSVKLPGAAVESVFITVLLILQVDGKHYDLGIFSFSRLHNTSSYCLIK
jgi:hypothetical protein